MNGAVGSPGVPDRTDQGTTVEPVRTCIGCRRRDRRSVLLRVVAVVGAGGARAEPDPGRVRPGRGASLHPDLQCLAQAVKRRAFGRALRVEGAVDASPVEHHLHQLDHTAPPAPGRPPGAPSTRSRAGREVTNTP